MAASYEVVGPLAILKGADGKQRYYYAGAVLPDELPAEEVKRLVDTGLVAPVGGTTPKGTSKPAAAGKD